MSESKTSKVTFEELQVKVLHWAEERDLLHRKNALKQMAKVEEEIQETREALENLNKRITENPDMPMEEIKALMNALEDGLGDSTTTLIILANQVGMDLIRCLETAYEEIKDRTGVTVDGEFIRNK